MRKTGYHGNVNIVSERVRQAREKLGLSQTQLAAKMQVHHVSIDQQMISRIERNMRIVTDYELAIFSKVLRVDANWLLGDAKFGGE